MLGMICGPANYEYKVLLEMMGLHTCEVFMKVTSADPAPFDCYESFVVLWFWLGNFCHTEVASAIKLSCFHCL